MALTAGTRLGPYEITALIGEGGMGVVYRATDTNLGRGVAIKVLPDTFAHDPERLARFEREAKTLAALNHPHIAHIHGFEQSQGINALVMELVDGEDLAQRIAGGPLPLDEALPIARQIAEALEAAHEQAIIHRDLKPANIKVRPDGVVKVLDFGLAKALEPAAATSPSATQSPTLTSPAMTMHGVILGTATYMSPEQAKGKPADKRSDIWAFGCVLYEMLTGKRAFEGEDVSDTLAAVLRGEPDWGALPNEVPPAIRVVMRRCLDKDRRRRIADISIVRFVVDEPEISNARVHVERAAPQQTGRRRVGAIAIAALVASVATWVAVWTLRTESVIAPVVTRFPIAIDETQSFGSNGLRLVAISPDGAYVAYAASPDQPEVSQGIYVRSMAEGTTRPLVAEARGVVAANPIFSPDGQSIAYYVGPGSNPLAQGKGTLKRIRITGGESMTLAAVELPLGMSWNGDSIVLGQPSRGIIRIPERGGEPEQIVAIKEGEIAQGPQLLPGGEAVLFTLARGNFADPGVPDEAWDKAEIVVQSLTSGERKTLIQGGSDARYLSSGHLVYAVAGTLRAVPFDTDRLRLTGTPAPVVEGIGRTRLGSRNRTGSTHLSVSESGSLVYLPGPVAPSAPSAQTLAFFDRRTGAIEPLKLKPASYEFPCVSPDGRQIAVGITNDTEANVWIYELSGSSALRQLTSGGRNRFPVWSADGQHVAFQSDREGDRAIFWQRADGGAPAVRLTKPDPGAAHIPNSWSPSSDLLLFDVEREGKFALWMLSVPDGKTAPFAGIQSGANQSAAAFSPNGRWVAYESGDVPEPRIAVQPVRITGTAFTIARGRSPRWSRDGKQLFYALGGRLYVVDVNTEPSFGASNPIPMLTQLRAGAIRIDPVMRSGAGVIPRSNYDVAADGHRILGMFDEIPAATGATRHLHVVLNWVEELKRLVPTR